MALARNTSIFMKLEAAYAEATGVFPQAADGILVYGDPVAAFDMEQEFEDLEPLSGTLTGKRAVPSVSRASSTITCYVQGSGKPAAKPYFAPLLEMCGLEETTGVGGVAVPPMPALTGRTYWKYAFRDTGFKSGKIAVVHEKVKSIMAGAYSNLKLTGTAGKPVQAQFSLSGQMRSIATDANPPVPVAIANRASGLVKTGMKFSGHSQGTYDEVAVPGLYCRSFTIDTGWTIVDRPDFARTTSEYGLAGRDITQRKPTLELVIEADEDLVDYDPWDRLLKGDISESIVWTQKSTEATPEDWIIYEILNPQVRTVKRTAGDGGRLLYTLNFNLINATAKNELAIWFASLT